MTTAVPESLRDGRYAVVRLLGEGGQASTFEAVDKKRGKLVVLKRFRVRGAKSWKEVELAEREARVLASLDHPAFPRYVEHFEEGGELYLVTEKIEGESLAELRKRGATLSEREVVRLLREASAALDDLHGRAPPVIHRDLKPSNVIRRPDGSFAFIDFGAVRDRMKPEGGSTVVGTFGYMAPEQFQGRALPASDVYAIGATALTLLTGCEPEDLPHKGLAIDVPTALRGTGTGSVLARALAAMLNPNPDERATRIAPLLDEDHRERGRDEPRGRRDGEERERTRREERERERVRREDRRARGDRGDEWGRFAGRLRDEWERASARERERWEREQAEWEREVAGWDAHRDRDAARQERRRAKREAREAFRAARRARRARERAHHGAPPPLVAAVFLLGLTIAQLALIVTLRMAVPVVLTALSLLFGRALREAAANVAVAGRRAGLALERAKDVVRGVAASEAEVRESVAMEEGEPRERSRVRIDAEERPRRARIDDDADDDDALADDEAHEGSRRRGAR